MLFHKVVLQGGPSTSGEEKGEGDMPQSSIHVLVIGAGLGGLCLAQGLRKAGIEVAIYERDAGLEVRTQGHRIHIDSRGQQALHQCLPPSLYELFLATRGQLSKGITVLRIVDGHLQEMSTQPFPEQGNDEFITVGSAVDRLTLRQILLASLEDITHFNKAFDRYEQQEDGRVWVYFTDGTRASGDVLVAADGVGSRIRQQFLPHTQVLDTSMRWLGGKTLLTGEIIPLLPEQMRETFTMLFGPHPAMMLGCVWFRTPPEAAAAQFWPGLSFRHTDDYLMWGMLGKSERFPIPDEDLQDMDSPALQRTALVLANKWYPPLSPIIQRADQAESFFLTMRRSVPIEHWQASNITLLGDAIHVMPANGSGANSALRDASQLARGLIAVESRGTPLHQALHDYESEMLRSGFGSVRASLQVMQGRRPGIPLNPDWGEWHGGQGN
jgi:2-polyprenyl-6-methoxyphenol hydroxylase-like FAD-dependent oxidoreductase